MKELETKIIDYIKTHPDNFNLNIILDTGDCTIKYISDGYDEVIETDGRLWKAYKDKIIRVLTENDYIFTLEGEYKLCFVNRRKLPSITEMACTSLSEVDGILKIKIYLKDVPPITVDVDKFLKFRNIVINDGLYLATCKKILKRINDSQRVNQITFDNARTKYENICNKLNLLKDALLQSVPDDGDKLYLEM